MFLTVGGLVERRLAMDMRTPEEYIWEERLGLATTSAERSTNSID